MRLPNGQPLWQNGTPHSMQRAPCSASSRSGRWSRNSLKSPTRSFGSRSGTPTRWTLRNAPSLPTVDHEPLARGRHRGLVLFDRQLLEHAAVVRREDLDELRRQRLPLVEHAPADRRLGPRDVLGDEVADLDRVGVVHAVEVIEQRRVDLRPEGTVLVEHEGQAAAHARGEVAPRRPEDDHAPAGHVLAAVVGDLLDDGLGARVAHAEALAADAAEERLAARRAIERDVADDDVLLGLEAGLERRAHGERAATQALAAVVVG